MTTASAPSCSTAAMSPSVSVRSTLVPARSSQPSTAGCGCPYGLPSPTGTNATAGATAAKNSGSWNALP